MNMQWMEKGWRWRAVLTSSLFVSLTGFAAVPQVSDELNTSAVAIPTSHWSVESEIQAHSVAGPASPWLGVAAAYRILDSLQGGLRGFVPLSHTVDDSTYAIQGYFRLRLSHSPTTTLFVEPEYSENFYNFIPFGSYGLSIGALTRVERGLSVGIIAGLEGAQVVIDSVGLENESGLIVYPKVGLLANLNF